VPALYLGPCLPRAPRRRDGRHSNQPADIAVSAVAQHAADGLASNAAYSSCVKRSRRELFRTRWHGHRQKRPEPEPARLNDAHDREHQSADDSERSPAQRATAKAGCVLDSPVAFITFSGKDLSVPETLSTA